MKIKKLFWLFPYALILPFVLVAVVSVWQVYGDLTAEAYSKKDAVANLVSSNQKLLESNRELESFSYSVSHDLRAPLRAIRGFTEIVVDDGGGQLDSKNLGFLQKVIVATDRMNSLIDGLLNISRVNRRELLN